MLRIAIAGCGQIGSRHLQSLAQLEESAEIHLIDPSPESIAMSKKRFEEVLPGKAAELFSIRESKIEELGPQIDVAIIASSSRHRASITRELLKNTDPKFIIFEKFLFQLESDYDEIGELLSSRNVKAWVNQWISSSYAFRRIANWIGGEGPVLVELNGDEWGLACNSVHFVDFFDNLTGNSSLEVLSRDLDDGMLAGKREGSYEVTGTVEIQGANGSILRMNSTRAESDGLIHITITRGDRVVRAVLARGDVSCDYIDSDGSIHEEYLIPMQSNVTGKIIQRLMLTGECDLPKYERSAYHHKLLLRCFESHFRENCDWVGDGCPIT